MPLVISNKIHLGTTLKILTAQCRHLSTGVDSQLLQQKPLNMLVRMAEQKSHQKATSNFVQCFCASIQEHILFPRVRPISFLLLGVNYISEQPPWLVRVNSRAVRDRWLQLFGSCFRQLPATQRLNLVPPSAKSFMSCSEVLSEDLIINTTKHKWVQRQ